MNRGAQARANAIRLKRQYHAGAIVLVEGRDDRVFCEQFFDKRRCKAEVMEGKSNVIEVKQMLDLQGVPGVMAMVDRDHDAIEGVQLGSDFVMPDYGDLECMLIHSPALDRILVEYGSREKLDKLEVPAQTMILEAAAEFGRLRLVSRRRRLALKFDGLDYSKCVDEESLGVDEVKMIQCVLNRSMRHDLKIGDIAREVEVVKREGHDRSRLASGEDAIELLSLALRRLMGTNSGNDVDVGRLRASLRFAYSHDSLKASGLWAGITKWHSKNRAFGFID